MNNEENLSKLERKRKKAMEREEAELNQKANKERIPNIIETVKKIGIYLIAGTILFGLVYILYGAVAYSSGPLVHWHANVTIETCGLQVDLPRIPSGASHLGNDLLHTHDDNVIHVEGVVKSDNDIKLGAFFDAIKVPFSENQIYNFKNGEGCSANSSPGKVKMLVDGKENTEFRNHVVKDQEDIIIIYN
ncbi:hypothetical protein HY570_03695 [Candidatus Micrarchaeota archaeon]|nr:hypothetical protein [Candidatus Micrarchaeota archaeon]